uniref:Uncharacterized protein n=1 Tax=Arundo donax TaxID=35708 RepID=A0A0A9F450_ARUDO
MRTFKCPPHSLLAKYCQLLSKNLIVIGYINDFYQVKGLQTLNLCE